MWPFFRRAGRTLASLVIAGGMAKIAGDQRLFFIQPVIAGIAKLLRDKYPDQFNWLPV